MLSQRRRRLILRKRVSGASGPATESVFITAATIDFGTVTGGGGNVVTVLGDESDATYLQDADLSGVLFIARISSVDFAALTLDAGRGIASFTIALRVSTTNQPEATGQIDSFAGITVSAGAPPAYPSGTGNMVFPFTKSGGGTWSAATFNAMTCRIIVNGDAGLGRQKLIDVKLTVTYA